MSRFRPVLCPPAGAGSLTLMVVLSACAAGPEPQDVPAQGGDTAGGTTGESTSARDTTTGWDSTTGDEPDPLPEDGSTTAAGSDGGTTSGGETDSETGVVDPPVDWPCTRFVALDGDDGNAGTSQDAAWRTISYAASQAVSGDKVCIKAGNYGAERVVVGHDGTMDAPIIFEGYTEVPGDDPDLGWSYPGRTSLDPNVMPLVDGLDRSANIGILMERDYIHSRRMRS